MDVEIRPVREDEFVAWSQAISASFGEERRPGQIENDRKAMEWKRSLAAFDGEEIVGGSLGITFRMLVPGRLFVPACGVTGVGVKPTHRRRGILSALMRRHLDDLHDAGEPLAILYTSEGDIYGRFGFGLASYMCGIEVERSQTAFLHTYRPAGRVRLVQAEAAYEICRGVYERHARTTPGMVEDSQRDWRYRFYDPEDDRDGASPLFFAVHEAAGEADAYAAYRIKRDWDQEEHGGVLRIEELMATSPQAYADIWRYCFDVDLIERITAWNRPIDDPLLLLLRDPKRLGLKLRDGLWVRPVRIAEALEARRFALEGGFAFELRDGFCPWNEGRYLLEGGPEGAVCRTTDASPDLLLDVTDLGAVYLGGVGFRDLARAGRVVEETPGSLARADGMFASDPAPWNGYMF